MTNEQAKSDGRATRENPESVALSGGYLFEQIRVPRGCLGYIAADPATRLAAIVDPELEMVEPMLDYLFAYGLRPRYIVDTHTHADHISGARDLKSKTTARLVMHEKAPASGIDIRLRDGDRLYLGELRMEFLYTPGHAKDLVSVVLPGKLLTADAMLIGSCGRTDLLNGDAAQQYHTLYHTLKSLPDELEVWPGHDYKGRSYSRLGDEKQSNGKMNFASGDEFIHYMDHENPGKLPPVHQLADSLKANMS